MVSHNILDHLALCHTHIAWSAITGMKSILQTVHSQIVVMSSFVPCAHSILRLPIFITKQFIVLTYSTKAETGHLLQASHYLHHYSPKATSLCLLVCIHNDIMVMACIVYVTWYESIELMCTQNLTTYFSGLQNFITLHMNKPYQSNLCYWYREVHWNWQN